MNEEWHPELAAKMTRRGRRPHRRRHAWQVFREWVARLLSRIRRKPPTDGYVRKLDDE